MFPHSRLPCLSSRSMYVSLSLIPYHPNLIRKILTLLNLLSRLNPSLSLGSQTGIDFPLFGSYDLEPTIPFTILAEEHPEHLLLSGEMPVDESGSSPPRERHSKRPEKFSPEPCSTAPALRLTAAQIQLPAAASTHRPRCGGPTWSRGRYGLQSMGSSRLKPFSNDV